MQTGLLSIVNQEPKSVLPHMQHNRFELFGICHMI